MSDETKEWVVFVLLFIFISCFGLVGVKTFNKYRCKNTAQIMGFEYRYSNVSGCFVKVNGEFIPADNYRKVAE